MMQEKFLMLADKLGVEQEVMGQIKEGFEKDNKEYEEKVEKEAPEEVVKVDISKTVEPRMPDEEDIDKRGKEEWAVLAKTLMKKPKEEDMGRRDGQEHSPYMMMMKKHGY